MYTLSETNVYIETISIVFFLCEIKINHWLMTLKGLKYIFQYIFA